MKELTYKRVFENQGELINVFIPTNKEWISTESQNLSVIESGEAGILFQKIVDDINNATEMVCLQSFLIQDTIIIDALLEAKQKRDVKVFVMDSAEARLNNSGFEEDESFATKDYKKMLEQKFKNNFVHRQANNLHAKFILIDPVSNPKGYLFTGNFNQKPFFENPELAVNLSKEQIDELFKVFVYHFWEYTTDEQTESNEFDKVKPEGRFNKPSINNILITSPDKDLSNLKEYLASVLSKAQKEIVFSTFGFDINNELSQIILQKLKLGIKVAVFCRPREKAIINNIEVLAQNGAKVFCHPLIHSKTILIDNIKGVVFTANFESHGMNSGFEVGVTLNEKQLIDIKQIIDNWKDSFPLIFEYKKAIRDTHRYICLSDTRKSKMILPEKTESKQEEIRRTEHLVSFFTEIEEPPEYSEKTYTAIRIASLVEMQDNYSKIKTIVSGIDLIEYEKIKKKKMNKEKALLIDVIRVNINEKLLELIEKDYKGFKLFAK